MSVTIANKTHRARGLKQFDRSLWLWNVESSIVDWSIRSCPVLYTRRAPQIETAGLKYLIEIDIFNWDWRFHARTEFSIGLIFATAGRSGNRYSQIFWRNCLWITVTVVSAARLNECYSYSTMWNSWIIHRHGRLQLRLKVRWKY